MLDSPLKKVAILQSNYVPWSGYFQLLDSVDQFILYDDVQFTKNDWRNRNRVKTCDGVKWLTIPTGQGINRTVREVEIVLPWRAKHWRTLQANYARAPYFDEVASWLKPLYLASNETNLSRINRAFIEGVCGFLGINTVLTGSDEYELVGDKNTRLVNICLQAGASVYVSGPSAKSYLDQGMFSSRGISVEWFSYPPGQEYPQLWGGFLGELSVVDFLFNCGPKARYGRDA